MSRKKWITKSEVINILRTYSIRPDEFEQHGNDGYFYMSKYVKGYSISISPEIQHGNVKTERIIVSHARNGGKRTFRDVWEHDANGKLQFIFRSPWDKPFTDYDYIQDLETQILELKEAGQKLQEQLGKSHGSINDAGLPPEFPDLTRLRAENETLRNQVTDLTKKYEELIKKTGHNARGAGRKADPAHLKAQAKKSRNYWRMEKPLQRYKRLSESPGVHFSSTKNSRRKRQLKPDFLAVFFPILICFTSV